MAEVGFGVSPAAKAHPLEDPITLSSLTCPLHGRCRRRIRYLLLAAIGATTEATEATATEPGSQVVATILETLEQLVGLRLGNAAGRHGLLNLVLYHLQPGGLRCLLNSSEGNVLRAAMSLRLLPSCRALNRSTGCMLSDVAIASNSVKSILP